MQPQRKQTRTAQITNKQHNSSTCSRTNSVGLCHGKQETETVVETDPAASRGLRAAPARSGCPSPGPVPRGPSHGTPSGPRTAAVCPQTCPSLPCTPFTSSFPCDEPRNWKRSLFCYGFADRCSEASAAWMLAQRRCPPSPWPPWWEQPGDAWVFPERLPNPLCPCLPLVRLFPGQILPTQHPPLGLRGTGRAKAAIWGCSSWLPSSVSPLPRGDPRAPVLAFSRKVPAEGVGAAGASGHSFSPPRSHVSPRCSGQVGQ